MKKLQVQQTMLHSVQTVEVKFLKQIFLLKVSHGEKNVLRRAALLVIYQGLESGGEPKKRTMITLRSSV